MDVVAAGNEVFAYTRGKSTEFIFGNYTNENFRKVIKPPHPLIILSFLPDGQQIAVLCSPETKETYKQAVMLIYDAKSGNIVKNLSGKDRHTVMTCYDSSVAMTSFGMTFIWATIMQINFWNLETGEERITLKTVQLPPLIL